MVTSIEHDGKGGFIFKVEGEELKGMKTRFKTIEEAEEARKKFFGLSDDA